MRLVFGQDEDVSAFVAQGLGINISPPFVAIGVVDRSDNPIGGIVFNQWNGANLEITIYGRGIIQRGIIAGTYWYAFEQCGASRLTAKTKRSNKLMRKLLPRLGYKYEGTMKNYYKSGDDALIFRLDPEEAQKWMTHGRA